MRFFKVLPLIAFCMLAASLGQARAEVKSYREWKTERVQNAQQRISSVKNQIDNRKAVKLAIAAHGTDPNLAVKAGGKDSVEAASSSDYMVEKLERQLRDERYSLELAKDLSVTDYFVGYLTKVQNKKSAFNEVAGKLSAEEVAELMNAYANSVFGAQSADFPVSAANMEKTGSK